MSGPDFAGVLYDHRQGALTCYDHPPTVEHPAWCCVCGDHELMVSHRAHLSAALHAEVARWLADEGAREAVARAIALTDDYDGCFLRRDEALAAGDADDARDEDEDCAWWTKRATAALAALTTTEQEGDR